MKKIWFWTKFSLGFLLVALFFILFFQNRGVVINDLNYIFGSVESISLSTLILITFVAGAIFSLILTLLINIPLFVNRLSDKRKIDQLERELATVKENSTI